MHLEIIVIRECAVLTVCLPPVAGVDTCGV